MPSTERPGTCQLESHLWAEATAWGVILSVLIGARAHAEVSDVEPGWKRPADWELSLQRTLRWQKSNRRVAAKTSDILLWGVSPAVVVVLIGASAVPALRLGDFPTEAVEDLYIVATCAALAASINEMLKVTVRRARPDYKPQPDAPRQTAGVHSFASGHAISAFGVASAFATVYWRRGYAYPWIPALAGGLVAATVGYLRVASQAHWASDVVGGALFGIAAGTVYPYFAHRPKSSAQEQSWWIVPQDRGITVGLVW